MQYFKKLRGVSVWVWVFTVATILAIIGGYIAGKKRLMSRNNLLKNSGFENGKEGWQWLEWSGGWAPFKISDKIFRSGIRSAYLPVDSTGESRRTVVWGVVQEVTVKKCHIDCLEGYYYVGRWERGANKQYLQVVIIDLSRKVKGGGNAQIRYILSGVDSPPYNLGNAHYVFVDSDRRKDPKIKKWIYFSMDPSFDFATQWGYEPKEGHLLRVLFEARFDDYILGQGRALADVYYDDLYLGPRTPIHCMRGGGMGERIWY